jgi:hypothetical protein
MSEKGSGEPCYYNENTGESQWERPAAVGGGADMEMASMSNPMGGGGPGGGGGHHARASTQMPSGWDKHYDEEGNRFYEDAQTGATSWDAPEGATGGSTGIPAATLLDPAHARSGTVMPPGWEADYDGDDKYYVDPDGNTQWDKPPGNN